MTQPDEFGHDPAVQMMRRVFKQMEMRQKKIIQQAGISSFDPGLRHIRQKALADFERTWASQARSSAPVSEDDYAILYENCLLERLKGAL